MKRSSSLMIHGFSFDEAAQLWADGYRPDLNTRADPLLNDGGWQTYYSLGKLVGDVSVYAFTVNRPALQWEIAIVRRAPVAISAPAPEPVAAPRVQPERSRMQLLEID
jgi:hypothetical protein